MHVVVPGHGLMPFSCASIPLARLLFLYLQAIQTNGPAGQVRFGPSDGNTHLLISLNLRVPGNCVAAHALHRIGLQSFRSMFAVNDSIIL